MATKEITIRVNSMYLDQAIEKANRLLALLEQIQEKTGSPELGQNPILREMYSCVASPSISSQESKSVTEDT